ncbi:hypothetical protein SB724_21450, partial [Bacillus sp. SIMBA_031]
IDLAIQNDELDKKNLNFLNEVKNDLRRMSGLNKSLLMLSKIDNNQFAKTVNVNFNELISELLNEYQDFIEYKKIEVNLV